MKKKVYLIQPSFRKMDGTLLKGGFLGQSILNLPILSAVIPDDWEKECCLEYNDPINYNSDAGVVFIIATSNDILHGYDLVLAFKRKGKLIIHGGYQDTFSIDLMKRVCDSVYHGIPGKDQMRIILEDALAGNLKPEYDCGTHIDFPFDYSFLKGRKINHIQFFSSVGCRFKCDYCCQHILYDGIYKLRSIENVITDLKSMRNFSRYIGFRDPNFYNDRRRIIDLCHAIISERINVSWAAQCPVYVGADHEVLKKMRDAGCKLLFIGLETLNQDNLASVNKPFKVKDYPRYIAEIHASGISTVGYFMFGFDHDTPESFSEVFSFVKKTKLSLPIINIYTPLPGTRLFNRLKDEGRLDYPDLDSFLHDKPIYSVPCNRCYFTPQKMTKTEVEQGFMELFRKLTSLREIFMRSLKPNPDMFKLLYLNFNQRRLRFIMEIPKGNRGTLMPGPNEDPHLISGRTDIPVVNNYNIQ